MALHLVNPKNRAAGTSHKDGHPWRSKPNTPKRPSIFSAEFGKYLNPPKVYEDRKQRARDGSF